MSHDVLISYSSKDKLQANAICNRLETQGIRCWIAPRDVPLGTEYADSIVSAIESSKAMVLVFSSNANASQQVRREVERAVSKGVTIIPVRIEDIEMSHTFEYYVSSMHWLDAMTPPLEAHIDRLARDLKALLAKDDVSGPAPEARAPQTESTRQVEPAPSTPSQGGGWLTPRSALVGVLAAGVILLAFWWTNRNPAVPVPPPAEAQQGEVPPPPPETRQLKIQPPMSKYEAMECLATYSRNGQCDWSHWSEMYERCRLSHFPPLADEKTIARVKNGGCKWENWSSFAEWLNKR